MISNKLKVLLISIVFAVCCTAYTAEVPELVGLAEVSESGSSESASMQLIKKNRDTLNDIIQNYSALEADIRKKLKNDNLALEYRLIYAAILAACNNRDGEGFLIEQGGRTINLEKLQNIFWTIVNYTSVLPVNDPIRKNPDLKWAASFMVNEYKKANVSYSSPYERRALVNTYLLPQLISMKNIEVYNIMHPNDPISETDLLTDLNNVRTVQIMIGKLLSGRDKHVQAQLAELVSMNSEPAIKLLLYNLSNPRACRYLAKFKDKRVLPAIKKEIPQLKGKAKVEAAVIAAKLEKADLAPVLVKLTEGNDSRALDAALKMMAGMQDKRFVSVAREVLNSPRTLQQADYAISILRQYNSRETIRGLIGGMYVDYNAIAPDRGERIDSTLKYNQKLREILKEFTKVDRGINGQAWLNWYIEKKRHLTLLDEAKPIKLSEKAEPKKK